MRCAMDFVTAAPRRSLAIMATEVRCIDVPLSAQELVFQLTVANKTDKPIGPPERTLKCAGEHVFTASSRTSRRDARRTAQPRLHCNYRRSGAGGTASPQERVWLRAARRDARSWPGKD